MTSSLDHVMQSGDGSLCSACGAAPACPIERDAGGVVAPRCVLGLMPHESASPAADASRAHGALLAADAASPAPARGVVVHNADAMLREAVAAHGRGWPLTPLNGKKPMLKEWQKRGMPTLEQVVAWAAERNLGVLTGAESGFVVIDDDTDDLSAVMSLNLPATVTAITGSGKRHYYFTAPEAALKNSVGTLGPGIDVRANGGQIVLPGSTHPKTGELYRWLEGHDPDSIEMAPFPMPLMDILRPKRRRPKVTGQARLQQHARGVLRDACLEVAQTPEGSRRDALNRAAFTAGGYSEVLDLGHATNELRDAGLAAGLGADEVEETIRNGLRDGQAKPFDRPRLLSNAGIEIEDPDADLPDPPRDAGGRPEIFLIGGELPKIVFACQDVLLGRPRPLVFQRGGVLVRILRSDPVSMREAQSATPGRLHAVEVTQDWLRTVLTDFAIFYRFDKRSEQYFPVDCPATLAKVVLELSGSWKLPCLLTITNAPTLRTDGSVLEEAGYDPATTVYFDPGNVVFPRVPEAPTREDALQALNRLNYVLKDFPFETPADQSVILAAILTALIRPSLRAAPLFGITAPKMASGKSLLGDLIALVATGRVGQAMPQGKDEDEDRKRLLAILKEGDPVAVLDNVERPLGGGALCAALTQEIYRDRILGSTRTVAFPTTVTWIATGNNLVVEGDLTTRVLISRLDAGVERPEEREFEIDPRRYVIANRGALVVAGLTVLRAYFVAGRPKQRIPQFGRFEDFSDIVRSALVWLEEADPCEVRLRIEDADPERQLHAEFMYLWLEIFGPESLTAAQVVRRVDLGAGGVESASRLRELLGEVAAKSGGVVSAHRLGMWLGRKRDRIEGGMRIVQAGFLHRASLWAVVAPDGPDARHPFGAGAEKPPQPRHPRTLDFDQRPTDLLDGEGGEAGGAISASSPIEVRHAPYDGGDVDPSIESCLVDPGLAATIDASSRTPLCISWPSTPCYRCGCNAFWRLRNDGLGKAGESRCERCYPVHPPEHLIERFDAAEVRP
jgi:hypothetical protein